MHKVIFSKVYHKILNYINRCNLPGDCLSELKEQFPFVDPKTLQNIMSQHFVEVVKKSIHPHNAPDNVNKYYSMYMAKRSPSKSRSLLDLANELKISPALFARLILEKYLNENSSDNITKAVISQHMRNNGLITDPILAADVYVCVLHDKNYGPIASHIKHSIGHEYECLLKRRLDDEGLSYICEEEMREHGYDKTPDIKLQIPIGVDGHVVNWVESKASFGDELNHKTYKKEQFWSYWNRFGPGLVIYWFGFIKELDVNGDKGILIMDQFPSSITKMDPFLKLD